MTSKTYTRTSLGAVAVSLLLAGSAFAADLPTRKAPLLAPAPVFTWTGFYLGVTAGVQNLRDSWTTTGTGIGLVDRTAGASFNTNNFRLGGYGGYNWQMGQTVVGVEGDFAGDFGSSKTLNGIPGTLTFFNNIPVLDRVSNRPNWDASIRARAGYLIMPTTLLYATGGIAFQNINHSISGPGNANGSWFFQPEAGSNSTTRTGWTLGAGVEAAVSANWLVRAEYRYSDFGSNTTTYFAGRGPAGADSITARTRISSNIFSVGAAYKF